jgi:tRNA(fMet)-specific endonuclease VapC
MNLENMTWFLDTNIVIFCMRGKSPSAMRKMMNTPAAAIKIPFQVKAELLHGAAKSSKPVEGRRAVLEFIHPFQLILPSEEILVQYVMIRSELERSGSVISEADLWIAANNVSEFSRVPGLTSRRLDEIRGSLKTPAARGLRPSPRPAAEIPPAACSKSSAAPTPSA